MKLTVVGKSPAFQDAGGACSSYLVTEGDSAILLDCGNGAFGSLRRQADPTAVDAVFVSHLHADHFFDLVPYAFYLLNTIRGSGKPGVLDSEPPAGREVSLFGPPESGRAFSTVCEVWGMPTLIADSFSFREYDPDETISVGPFEVAFRAVPHYIPTWAISVTGPDGTSFVYGADCAPNDALAEFARGARLLIAEATLIEPEPDPDDRGHMTPRQAGELASRAGVERLLLTHISDEVDPVWAVAEASASFDGEVSVAGNPPEIDL